MAKLAEGIVGKIEFGWLCNLGGHSTCIMGSKLPFHFYTQAFFFFNFCPNFVIGTCASLLSPSLHSFCLTPQKLRKRNSAHTHWPMQPCPESSFATTPSVAVSGSPPAAPLRRPINRCPCATNSPPPPPPKLRTFNSNFERTNLKTLDLICSFNFRFSLSSSLLFTL